MSTIRQIIIPLLQSAVVMLLLQNCCTSPLNFSGRVVDKRGHGIPEASIQVGGKEVETNKNGEFKICVKRAERYILNVSKLNFGFVSKVYSDTSSRILITMAKATVARRDPKQEIVVEDVNPDISGPTSTSHNPVSSPLDTIPFVYDNNGALISFRMPKELKDTDEAVAQFQAPRRGARITIPANSLVLEGTERLPDDSIEISVNTIDLYSTDGMPGDYTVDLGKNQRGFMVSYGAANIEAFYDGKPLQLADGKTAVLAIPVDTLSIISRDSIPEEIPFLVYNNISGLWEQDGTAKLNAARDVYTKEVNHFSTFNMDMIWTGQSCIQLCDGISAAGAGTSNAIAITVPGKTKRMVIPGSTVCGSGATDCGIYGINGPGTHAIINLTNNLPVKVEVYKNASTTGAGGTNEGTYVFNSGPAPAGSPAIYQSCSTFYNDCAGPFRISDEAACYETSSPARDGTMTMPVMTFQFAGANIEFSWIFIENISGGTISNNPNYYQIEYQTYSPGEMFSTAKAWNKVDFESGLAQTETYPPNDGSPGTTDWNIKRTVDFSGPPSPNPTTTNRALNTSDIILFRVNYSADPVGTYTTGVVRALNMPPSTDPFTTAFNAAYPCNIQ